LRKIELCARGCAFLRQDPFKTRVPLRFCLIRLLTLTCLFLSGTVRFHCARIIVQIVAFASVYVPFPLGAKLAFRITVGRKSQPLEDGKLFSRFETGLFFSQTLLFPGLLRSRPCSSRFAAAIGFFYRLSKSTLLQLGLFCTSGRN